MVLNLAELKLSALKKAKRPLFLLAGDSRQLLREAMERLTALLLPEEERELGLEYVEGSSFALQPFLALCQTVPFMSQSRVVVLRDADALDADTAEALAPRLAGLPDSTALILDSGGSAVHDCLVKAVTANGLVINCTTPKVSSPEFKGWLAGEVDKHDKRLQPLAEAELLRKVGGDMGRLATEIAKVSTYIGKRTVIERKDVEAICSDTAECTVFTLCDAVAQHSAVSALRALRHLSQQNVAGPVIIVMLTRQFRLILQIKWLMERGHRPPRFEDAPPEELDRLPHEHNIVDLLRRQGWLTKSLVPQALAFDWSSLVKVFELLEQADLAMKGMETTGLAGQRLVLEMLVWRLCGVGRRRAR